MLSIEVTKYGICICNKDEHPTKADFLIEVTDDGIVIRVNEEHSLKAFDSINLIEFERTTSLKFLHKLNEFIPIVLTKQLVDLELKSNRIGSFLS